MTRCHDSNFMQFVLLYLTRVIESCHHSCYDCRSPRPGQNYTAVDPKQFRQTPLKTELWTPSTGLLHGSLCSTRVCSVSTALCPLPRVLLYFHGGAFVLCRARTERMIVGNLATWCGGRDGWQRGCAYKALVRRSRCFQAAEWIEWVCHTARISHQFVNDKAARYATYSHT